MAAPARGLVPVNGARAATIRQPPMPALTNASCPAPNSPAATVGAAPGPCPRTGRAAPSALASLPELLDPVLLVAEHLGRQRHRRRHPDVGQRYERHVA